MHNSLSKLLAVFIFQTFFCWAIFTTIKLNESLKKVPTVFQSFCQFIAGMLMQMNINYEFAHGLRLMKYTLNHEWKFKYPYSAFMSGLLQVISTVITAGVCYAVIISSPNILDLAKDFTALMIIIDFDNYFANTSSDDITKDIIENSMSDGVNCLYTDIFTIETTTSSNAR
jgi:hypothetical protein